MPRKLPMPPPPPKPTPSTEEPAYGADERTMIVLRDTGETYVVAIPNNCKITYGPWAPPNMAAATDRYGGMRMSPEKLRGTLRVYRGSKENIVFLMTGVTEFYEECVEVKKIDPALIGGLVSSRSEYVRAEDIDDDADIPF